MKFKKIISKEMMKNVGIVMTGVGAVFLSAVFEAMTRDINHNNSSNMNTYSTGYDKKYITLDDAVEAIVHSSMCSDDKSDAIAAMKNDSTREYYAAIINIANSSMYSSSKREAIIRL